MLGRVGLVLLSWVCLRTQSQRFHHDDSWPGQALISDGLCRYGNSVECCWGWRQTDWGGRCQPDCQQDCKHGECVGPDRCKCHPGYTGKTCNQDLNECGVKPRPCKHRCMNTHGSYKCYCLDGYTLQPDGGCRNARTCSHANCQYGCEVVKGTVQCTCPSPGLRLGPDRRSCVDIDECVLGGGVCPRRRKCVNTFGSFMCKCHFGFKLTYINGRYNCIDKDSRPFCSLNPDSPKCRCKDGSCKAVLKVTVEPQRPWTTTTTRVPRKTTTPTTRATTSQTTTTTRPTTTPETTRVTTATTRPTTTPTTTTNTPPTTTITTTMSPVTTAQPTTTQQPDTTMTATMTTTTTTASTTTPQPATTTKSSTPVPTTTTVSTTAASTATTPIPTTMTTPVPATTKLHTKTTTTISTTTTTATTATPATTVSTTPLPTTTTTTATTTTTITTTEPTPTAPTTTASTPTSLQTTTVDNRINKEVTQRLRGDVHIPRHPGHNQVWEFDIELGNTAEDANDDPVAGVLHCSFDHGMCDWLSDREGDLHWQTAQNPAGGRYLSVPELKAGQRSMRGARLAVQLVPPWSHGDLCFSFSHWLTGHQVGVLQLFVRKKGWNQRYSPALWSRTGGHGWRHTKVTLTTHTLDRVLLKAERRKGRRGEIAVDDVTLRRGACR